MMMDEFYYWMYRGLRKIRKEEDPAFDAFLGVFFFTLVNITVIGRVIYNITEFNLTKEESKIVGVIFAAIVLTLGYFRLYKRRVEIFNKINQFSDNRRRKGKRVFIAYIIISGILFYMVTLFF
ncbi:hypothetical protein [Pseudopedobacter beijingensis]|uniref:DUF202 domain-containing protein n=1 Tax=Pseudopedobacter beijingensis TaxID=1207056 RepID=A0ABW4II88_9SPHI